MSDPIVTVDRATEDDRYLATDKLVWFDENEDLPTADQLLGVPPGQRFAADTPDADRGSYPGIYGVRPMQLSVPRGSSGRWVPMAGLTWVGVHPDHRRRGVLRAMVRHHVEQTHREGVAVSGLHASEPAIYGRYGYGLASQSATLAVSRGTTFTAPGLDETAAALTTRLATETGETPATNLDGCCSPPATGWTSSSPPSAAGRSGNSTDRPAHSRCRPSSALPRPGWPCSDGWSTSTWSAP